MDSVHIVIVVEWCRVHTHVHATSLTTYPGFEFKQQGPPHESLKLHLGLSNELKEYFMTRAGVNLTTLGKTKYIRRRKNCLKANKLLVAGDSLSSQKIKLNQEKVYRVFLQRQFILSGLLQ